MYNTVMWLKIVRREAIIMHTETRLEQNGPGKHTVPEREEVGIGIDEEKD